jgi:hypothetical protein
MGDSAVVKRTRLRIFETVDREVVLVVQQKRRIKKVQTLQNWLGLPPRAPVV